ncbi:hypothetical protein [Formosa sp. L2A11]|uniref:hypothetical protein n=1 Tax=Formosa sp. L2A11 TaxID=2686363 RepID=UPI00131D7FCC|nr:hypothetical protein [Formosa sp. L2A11]
MKANLAPKLIQSVIDFTILWFEKSNQYIIIDNGLFFCIRTFLESKTKTACLNAYTSTFELSLEKAKEVYLDVEQFLLDRNTPLVKEVNTRYQLNTDQRNYTKQYRSGDLNFEVHFQIGITYKLYTSSNSSFRNVNKNQTRFLF